MLSRAHDIDYELLQAADRDRVGLRRAGRLAQGRARPHAGDAGHRAALRRARPTSARSIEKKLFDPRINIATGSRYLRDLIEMFPGRHRAGARGLQRGRGRGAARRQQDPELPRDAELREDRAAALRLPQALGGLPGRRQGAGARAHGAGAAAGGAIGRGNMPPDSRGVPAMPRSPSRRRGCGSSRALVLRTAMQRRSLVLATAAAACGRRVRARSTDCPWRRPRPSPTPACKAACRTT